MKCVHLENPDSRQILLFFRQSLHNIQEYIFIYKNNSAEYDIAVKLSAVDAKTRRLYKIIYIHMRLLSLCLYRCEDFSKMDRTAVYPDQCQSEIVVCQSSITSTAGSKRPNILALK